MSSHDRQRTRVKICGLTNQADRDGAVHAGADAVGFISGVSVDTPRELSRASAANLVAGVPPFVTSVLVTMPKSVEEAVSVQRQVGADAVQIHGSLGPAAIETASRRLDAQLIAAIDVHDEDAETYAAVADTLLVDSTDEDGGGGTGETHDWEQTREYCESLAVPVVLAGGLTPDNVGRAIATADPFGVDVASGVERSGGEKDHDALTKFVDEATKTEVIAGER